MKTRKERAVSNQSSQTWKVSLSQPRSTKLSKPRPAPKPLTMRSFTTRYFYQILKRSYFPATPVPKLNLPLMQASPPLLHQVQHLHRPQALQVRLVLKLQKVHQKLHLEMSPGSTKCWTKSQPWKKNMQISFLHGKMKGASYTLQKSGHQHWIFPRSSQVSSELSLNLAIFLCMVAPLTQIFITSASTPWQAGDPSLNVQCPSVPKLPSRQTSG